MEKLHASIGINAPRAKVWDTMFDAASYREWTLPFNPGPDNTGSHYVGDWSEGSKMLFVGSSPDGSGEAGMVSRIKENRPHEFMSIEHVGIVMNGVEDTTSEMAKKWAPAFENYTLTDKDGGTEVAVEVDINAEEKATFEKMWPEALQKLKELAEK